MKLLTFRADEGLKLGVVTDQGVLDVAKASAELSATDVPSTVEQVLDQGDAGLQALVELTTQAVAAGNAALFHNEVELKIGPCVSNPGKIICVGLNYRKHAEESKMPVPEYPILFNKFSNSIAGDHDVVSLPKASEQVDYEAELTIVIGKTAKNVAKEKALDYVFGYCNGNDLSARDLQFRTNQWLLGKALDGFAPVGPYLVTTDEVGHPNELGIRSYVNGEIRQNSNTADMVFHCDEIVSYVSQFMTLEPGDIIMTGTPEGVIMGYPQEQQVWLQDGDEVVIEIEKLGRLTNTMRAQA